MLLKEALSLFTFISGIFTISGFAVRIDKFEHNHIIKKPENNQTQILLPLESFYKLKLKGGENFKYWVGKERRIKKISQISSHRDHAILIFEEPKINEPRLEIEPIKYYLESRPFWINLFQ